MLASKKLIALFAVLSLGAAQVQAADDTSTDSQKSETAVKAKDLAPKNKVKGDIDEEITNRKMRADLGSKSKYSGSLSLGYYGGNFEKPFGKARPNVDDSAIPDPVALSGSISGRYRLDARSSITLGVGLQIVQPFHEPQKSEEHDKYEDKVDIANPSLSYSYAHKVAGIQMVEGLSLGVSTSDYSTGINDQFGGSISNVMIFSLGKAKKLQVGLASYLSATNFGDKVGDINTGKEVIRDVDVTRQQRDWGISLYPFVEYVINDKLNFRTVFRQTTFNHNKSLGPWALTRNKGSQSIGLGISVTRDVFLYPNFQFSTENLSAEFLTDKLAEQSTVGMSATINAF